MAQAQTNTSTQNNNGTAPNGNGAETTKQAKVLTPGEAIGKIGKLLEQLSPKDQKRVIAFFAAESAETGESSGRRRAFACA